MRRRDFIATSAAAVVAQQTGHPQNATGPTPSAAPALYRGGADRLGYVKEVFSPPLTLLWKFATFTQFRNNTSSPIASGDGRLFFAVSKDVYGVDAETGEPLWKKKGTDDSYTYSLPLTDAVASPLAFFPPNLVLLGTKATRDKSLIAVNADTGAVAWDFNAGGAVYSSPVLAGNQVLFGTTSGKIWGATLTPTALENAWSVSVEGAVTGALAVAGNLAYAASGDVLYAINLTTKRIVWQGGMGDTTNSGPVIVGSQVIVAAGERLVGFQKDSGARLWTRALASNARINGSPAVRGTTLFFGADEFVYAFDFVQGRSPWKKSPVKVDGRVLTSPFVSDTGAFAATIRGHLFGFSPSDGAVQWTYRLPTTTKGDNGVSAAPLIHGGRYYVLADDGTLFCFAAENVDVGAPEVLDASLRVVARDRKPAKYPVDPWADDVAPDELFTVPGKGPIGFEFLLEDQGSGVNWDTLKVFLDDNPVKLVRSDSSEPVVNKLKSTVTLELLARPTEGTSARPLADGIHKVRLEVRNWAGNEVRDVRPFRVDNSALPPDAPVRDPANAGGGNTGGFGGQGGRGGSNPAGGGRGGGGRGGGGSGS